MSYPTLHAAFVVNHQTFHQLLAALSDDHLRQPSDNPAWNVRACLFHITLGLEYLPREVQAAQQGRNYMPGPQWLFDIANLWYTRLAALPHTRATLGARYDRVHQGVLAALNTVRDDEWAKPIQFFYRTTTLAGLFQAQIDHLREHTHELRRRLQLPSP